MEKWNEEKKCMDEKISQALSLKEEELVRLREELGRGEEEG